ncbi:MULTISPECIES: bifunctional phosphoribosyl-AMP cyclohydrolase/phosphoribosyl-ATP diphosphatase HisIE [Shouchella]|uniref:bifunctional phosphoribosyl-AMP cyclohydrolase/phosphoribosyl-ATP diphosphatase HisIE n=1 Tax=Shouchella TaxID=2893057 RepID=UPI000786D729|nr:MULTISPECIES: bifunctional phosphoribosyl-AMP cyclohydrolase/phosphoribosyl-ATP diphosphatase HisIE [Shouchella]MEB5478549.1 bifunctional phosphoribosyl-AMP cyclohydrolase/phosphoribosyl-ATP diphosphatase HisIE [Shouchella clausii]PAD12705.1 bifunctional phosphoribosyl-AMP cyclohydrolase/phosphoribosyl-ATP diphosphatase HisIE [Shouchella clausii]
MKPIRFDKDGLVPAIVQDANSKAVLTLAYMNEESLQKTIETKETWFYSRSRQQLWHKGETSGNTQHVVDVRYDCDQDAVLVLVEPKGPACHTGAYSCFSQSLTGGTSKVAGNRFQILNDLEETIAKREAEKPEGAYTTYLFTEGVDKILKKVGEEAGEVIIAAKNRDPEELRWEVADLFYHVLVLLQEQKLPLDRVLETLDARHQS